MAFKHSSRPPSTWAEGYLKKWKHLRVFTSSWNEDLSIQPTYTITLIPIYLHPQTSAGYRRLQYSSHSSHSCWSRHCTKVKCCLENSMIFFFFFKWVKLEENHIVTPSYSRNSKTMWCSVGGMQLSAISSKDQMYSSPPCNQQWIHTVKG